MRLLRRLQLFQPFLQELVEKVRSASEMGMNMELLHLTGKYILDGTPEHDPLLTGECLQFTIEFLEYNPVVLNERGIIFLW